jgi:hypothetical protein
VVLGEASVGAGRGPRWLAPVRPWWQLKRMGTARCFADSQWRMAASGGARVGDDTGDSRVLEEAWLIDNGSEEQR